MRRCLSGLLTLLSLVLFVATVVLGVRSYLVVDIVKLASVRLYKAASGGGGVWLQSLEVRQRRGDWRTGITPGTNQLAVYNETVVAYNESTTAVRPEPPPRWERKGYAYPGGAMMASLTWVGENGALLPRAVPVAMKGTTTFDNVKGECDEQWFFGRALWVPYWLPTVLFAAAPGLWMRREWVGRRAAHRRRQGFCAACGYDVRASADRCPECGAAVGSVAGAAA